MTTIDNDYQPYPAPYVEPWESDVCNLCNLPFIDMYAWADRHEESGEDAAGRVGLMMYHAECCPSCAQFDSNWVDIYLVEDQ